MKKVLIANRGEIAVRIIRACRELGLRSVAVHSDADRDALHVRLADEAYFLGSEPTLGAGRPRPYLHVERIVDVAQRCGADAIHPGYGFLSERAHFARACEAAGIVFVGPPADAIEAMGSKIEAKRIAMTHDVPVVPGYDGDDQSVERLVAEAERIGFPILIKASAGGGGKGMRVVAESSAFVAALEGAQREAKAAFGDDAVLLEKLIQRPRHVEIQVLGDAYGNLVYLGERECSIQRRHQKIIEESPSVALTPELRARMGEAAVRVARAVGYRNAGTVEFILDPDGNFYFLEMNTRLQVEHPVTEFVTGLDLVQLQLRIAAGEALPFTQDDITLRGHAIEARIYAEDPITMLPSIGRVAVFAPPEGPGIRNDVGIASGDEVTVNYDPMLAKLIVHAPTRAVAIERLNRALDEYAVLGVTTNIPLLQAIATHESFRAGDTTTDFLETHAVSDALRRRESVPPAVVIATALHDMTHGSAESSDPWARVWRVGGGEVRREYRVGDESFVVRATRRDNDSWTIRVGDHAYEARLLARRDHLLTIDVDQALQRIHIARDDSATLAGYHGRSYRLTRVGALSVDALGGTAEGLTGHMSLAAPMPGTIIKVLVRPGDRVAENQPLLVMEAMKMEHTIIAPHAGTVDAVPYDVGALVVGGATLIELTPEDVTAQV